MRIVVIGGSGLVGAKLVSNLGHRGDDVLSASPRSDVNTVTGEGLAKSVAGSKVVVDVTNSPSFEATAVMEFFRTSCRNPLAAEEAAHVKHHVALSVVGTDRLLESGYFRAKMAQEDLIKASPIPHTILHSTQFFDFMSRIAHTRAHWIEHVITARPRNEEDGCQVVEGLYRKAHFPPVHARNHRCRRSRAQCRTVTRRCDGQAGLESMHDPALHAP